MANPKQVPFRFFDNREKYLLFVTTCSEKWEISKRVCAELGHISPSPPALRLFDAGMGDATVLTHVMRELHQAYPTIPFLVVGKEISLEDVRLSLEKMADRFSEHPQSVYVITNMRYVEAPWLHPKRPEDQAQLKRWDIALEGSTAHEFDAQIRDLQPILQEGWRTCPSPKTGNPLYVNPSMLVIYRADHKFALDAVIPPTGAFEGNYDLIICAQPYRARLPAINKVKNVIAPLAHSLAPNGRMIVVQSTGYDPGMEIIRKIWPDEQPFTTPRHDLIQTLQEVLEDATDLSYSGYNDDGALFKYHLQALPEEINNIGTSTLLAAWNAAIYVAQIEDARLSEVLNTGEYLQVTREVLQKHGGLWFLDESFVISRQK